MLIIGGENMDYSKKLERRKQFEDSQFIRLTKIKSKPRYAYYLVVLIGLILLVDLLDNFVTSVNSNVTSCCHKTSGLLDEPLLSDYLSDIHQNNELPLSNPLMYLQTLQDLIQLFYNQVLLP